MKTVKTPKDKTLPFIVNETAINHQQDTEVSNALQIPV